MRCLPWLISALTMLVLAAIPARLTAEPQLWDLKVTPSPRLGLAFPGADPKYYGLISDMGIGVVRISAAWARVEPREGQFNFRGLDARVRGLQTHGLAPFLTFEPNAKWAADHTDKVKNGTPRDMAQWTRFIRAVVDRYDGDGQNDMRGLRAPVRYYQTANEFLSPTNRSGGWAGSNAALLAFADATYMAVKAEDPNAQLVQGGVASFNADIALLALRNAQFTLQQRWSASSKTVFDRRNLQSPDVQNALQKRFLPMLQQTRYDIGSVHLYGPETRDAARLALFQDLTGRPVISTECGGPTLDYDGSYTGQDHYRAVLHRNLNVWAAGSQFCLWFGLGEAIKSTFGNAKVQLYDKKGRAKPGTQAYRLLARLAPHLRRIQAQGAHGFALTTDRGPVWVAIGEAGLRDLAQVVPQTPAICINNAAKRDTVSTNWGQLHQTCKSDGITLAGAALFSLLQDG